MRISKLAMVTVGETKAIPWGYGLAYWDYARAEGVFCPVPINWIVRYWRRAYWGFLGAFYWVGLIDVGVAEAFSWHDFFRIKSH